jgi:hypothetical protein
LYVEASGKNARRCFLGDLFLQPRPCEIRCRLVRRQRVELAVLGYAGCRFLQKEGLDVELVYIASSPIVARATLAGDIVISGANSQVIVDVGHNHKEETRAIFARYTKINDPGMLDGSIQYGYDFMEKIPLVKSQAFQVTLDQIARNNPKAKQAKPEQFFDNSLVEELVNDGFFTKLWGKNL